MSFLHEFNETLSQAARTFTALGWSVIPLRGGSDLSASKAPALPRWRLYQRIIPDDGTLESWFGSSPSASNQAVIYDDNHALGIVLGQVSQLVVLDIDDPDRAAQFAELCVDLTDTLTVQSGNRRLPHYYFQIDADMHVPGRTINGCELRSDGQYVVAPGSRIRDKEWTVTHNAPPRILTERDLRRILRFLHTDAQKTQEKVSPALSEPNTTDFEQTDRDAMLTSDGLSAYYRSHATRVGRNNALFKATCLARDNGWSQADVDQALGPVHARQLPALSSQQTESLSARLVEAARTIASAFSRPARRLITAIVGLPNAIREALLQRQFVHVARVLDGLLLAGLKVGEQVTVASAHEAVTGFGIGRQSVIRALSAVIDAPPHTPPQEHAHAADWPNGQIKQCLFDRVAKPTKNRGRPSVTYVIPDFQQLAARLDIDPKQLKLSDPIQGDDLQSPARYRAALHTALLRRAPGFYPRQWLARRLGVSADSCRRYEQDDDIHVQAGYDLWLLTWDNVEGVIPDEPQYGQFLEDETGRRYPAKVAVARMLLIAGKRVVFKSQGANHYSVSTMQNVAVRNNSPQQDSHVRESISAASVPNSQLKPRMYPVASQECCGPQQLVQREGGNVAVHNNWLNRREEMLRSTTIGSAGGRKCCGPQQLVQREGGNVAVHNNYLSDAFERCADTLYKRIRALNVERSLTRKRAMDLVKTYGIRLIERGLKVIEKRTGIYNPAGFLMMWLRSEKQAVST